MISFDLCIHQVSFSPTSQHSSRGKLPARNQQKKKQQTRANVRIVRPPKISRSSDLILNPHIQSKPWDWGGNRTEIGNANRKGNRHISSNGNKEIKNKNMEEKIVSSHVRSFSHVKIILHFFACPKTPAEYHAGAEALPKCMWGLLSRHGQGCAGTSPPGDGRPWSR